LIKLQYKSIGISFDNFKSYLASLGPNKGMEIQEIAHSTRLAQARLVVYENCGIFIYDA